MAATTGWASSCPGAPVRGAGEWVRSRAAELSTNLGIITLTQRYENMVSFVRGTSTGCSRRPKDRPGVGEMADGRHDPRGLSALPEARPFAPVWERVSLAPHPLPGRRAHVPSAARL